MRNKSRKMNLFHCFLHSLLIGPRAVTANSSSELEHTNSEQESLEDILYRFRRSTSPDLPAPYNIEITDVSTSSIQLKWQLPEETKNMDNLQVKVMLYPKGDAYEDPRTQGMLDLREFHNLEPGKLYTFIIATTNGTAMCDPLVLNQDTVPLQPHDLQIKTFEYLDLELTFLGEIIPHRIDTSGIEAKWSPPEIGECDCYEAEIQPNEGHMITPSDRFGNPERGSDIRQFIHLVPGKEYTVKIWASTCGNGISGPLKSTPIINTILVPPVGAGDVEITQQNHDSLEVCWPGPKLGHFNAFEIEWHPVEMTDPDYIERFRKFVGDNTNFLDNPEEMFCHTIDNIRNPCTKYRVAVTTYNDEVPSLSASEVITYTRTAPPKNFYPFNFGIDHVDVAWQKPEDLTAIEGLELDIDPNDRIFSIDLGQQSYHVSSLSPGMRYRMSLRSYCSMPFENEEGEVDYQRIYSVPAELIQTCQPMPPSKCNLKCHPRSGSARMDKRTMGSDGFARSAISGSIPMWEQSAKEADYDLQVTQEIFLNVSWLIPQEGRWDGFVISYSPFDKRMEEYGVPGDNIPPFFVRAGKTIQEIYLPRSDQRYTVSISSIADGIQSEPLTMAVDCGNPKNTGNVCTPPSDKPHILSHGNNQIEVGLDHVYLSPDIIESIDGLSADNDGPVVKFYAGSGGGWGGSGSNRMIISSSREFCIQNPCDSVEIFFQVCTIGFDCVPKLVSAACSCPRPGDHLRIPGDMGGGVPQERRPDSTLHFPDPERAVSDACCGNKPYLTDDKICCHDQLYDKSQADVMCCGGEKYNKFEQRCCTGEEVNDVFNFHGWGLKEIDTQCIEVLDFT